MPSIETIRQQFPQYEDMDDNALADALHRRFYNDMPRADFNQRIGMQPPETERAPVTNRSTILPISRDDAGDMRFTVPRILDPFISAVTLPGEVMRGETPVMMDGEINPDVIRRSADFALTMSPGSAGSAIRIAPSSLPNATRATRPPMRQSMPTPIQQAAERQHVRMPRAATTESPIAADLARRVSDLPGVGQPLRRASQRAVQEIGEAAQRTVDDLGRGDVVTAGASIADDVTRYAGRGSESTLGRRVSGLYDEVDTIVDDTIQAPLRATSRAVADITRARQASGLPAGAAVQRVQPALERGALTYSGIKGLRTFYREAMDNPQILASMGMEQSQAQRIYGALSDDLRNAVQVAGGERGLRAFERANRTAQVVARERQVLQSILGSGVDRSPENIASRLQRLAGSTGSADIRTLSRVRRAVSRETWDEFASSVLANMGRSGPNADFSGARFLTAWSKLSPRGRSELFPNQAVRQNIDDIIILAERFKRLDELGNFSNSGSLGALTAAFAGGIVAPMQTAVAVSGPLLFSFIMSKPSSARVVTNWARVYEQALRNPTASALRALQSRASALAVIIANESGAQDAVQSIAEALTNLQLGRTEQPERQGA
jgi:hypothetical protein